MLKPEIAEDTINKAIDQGAKIYLPHPFREAIEQTPEWEILSVAVGGRVVYRLKATPDIATIIETDYRLESMYAQAQAFLLKEKKESPLAELVRTSKQALLLMTVPSPIPLECFETVTSELRASVQRAEAHINSKRPDGCVHCGSLLHVPEKCGNLPEVLS